MRVKLKSACYLHKRLCKKMVLYFYTGSSEAIHCSNETSAFWQCRSSLFADSWSINIVGKVGYVCRVWRLPILLEWVVNHCDLHQHKLTCRNVVRSFSCFQGITLKFMQEHLFVTLRLHLTNAHIDGADYLGGSRRRSVRHLRVVHERHETNAGTSTSIAPCSISRFCGAMD